MLSKKKFYLGNNGLKLKKKKKLKKRAIELSF